MKNHLLALFACAVCCSARPAGCFAHELRPGNPLPSRLHTDAPIRPLAGAPPAAESVAVAAAPVALPVAAALPAPEVPDVPEVPDAPDAPETTGTPESPAVPDPAAAPKTAPAAAPVPAPPVPTPPADSSPAAPGNPATSAAPMPAAPEPGSAQGPAALEPDSARASAADPAALERRIARLERLRACLPRISGYLQLGYEWHDRGTSEFFVRRVRLDLQGDLAPRLDYRFHIELAHPQLLDAFLRYRPFEQLNLQAGAFKIPFSIENTEYPPFSVEFIDYPLVLIRLMGFNDISGHASTGRGLGGHLYGGFIRRGGEHLLGYNLALLNGEGINAHDRNRSKDVVARLTLRPTAGLLLAASGYWGRYGERSLDRVRYGAGGRYDRGRFMLRGEYIWGRTEVAAAGDEQPLRRQRSQGWFLAGGWRASAKFFPVVRYDSFDEDMELGYGQNNYTLGLLWTPWRFFRFQLDYTYEEHRASQRARQLAAARPFGRHGVSVMLTGIF